MNSNSFSSYKFHFFSIIFLFSTLFLILLFISSRGLDITDDASYLLASRYPQDALATVLSFQHLIGVVFKAIDYDVVKLRYLCVAGILVSAAAIGWQIFLKYPFFVRLTCAAFTGLGGALYFVRGGLLSPSYNTLVFLTLNLSAVLYLKYCDAAFESTSTHRDKKSLLLIQGFLIGICLLSKAPSGVFLLCFWIITLWFLNRSRNVLIPYAFLMMGLGLFFLIYFIFIQGYQSWQEMFVHGLQTLPFLNCKPKVLFLNYILNFVYSFIVMLERFGLFFFLVLLSVGLRWSLFWQGLMWTGAFLMFIYHGYHMGGQGRIFVIFQLYLFLMTLSIALISVCCFKSIKNIKHFLSMGKSKEMAVLIGLTILPFIGVLGTSNPLAVTILMNMGPWFGCFLIIFLFVLRNSMVAAWSGSILLIVSLFAFSQIASAFVFDSYRLNKGILEQNVPMSLGNPPSQIMLDFPTATFFKEMKGIADRCHLRPGEDILAFLDMPGVVWALGGRSPGTSWWISYPYTGFTPEAYVFYNDFIFQLIPAQRVKQSYILERVNEFTIFPDLKTKGMNFPQDYLLCGEAVWPLDGDKIRLWRPKT